MPWIPGMDVAGVVDEVGEGTDTPLSVGDRVMAIVLPVGAHGGYREQIVLPAASVVPVPAGFDDAAAATLPMNGLTARLALDRMGLAPGQVLAVTGAAGAFGGYVVQLAKVDGLVVVADAADADRELVRSLGADVVLDRGAGFADAVLDRYPGGVDGLADGSLQGAEVARAVRDGGVVTTVRGYRGDDDALARGVRFEPVLVRDYGRTPRRWRPCAGRPRPARSPCGSPTWCRPSRRRRRTPGWRPGACAGGWCCGSELSAAAGGQASTTWSRRPSTARRSSSR